MTVQPDQGMSQLQAMMAGSPPGAGLEAAAAAEAHAFVQLGNAVDAMTRQLRRLNDRAAVMWAGVHPVDVFPLEQAPVAGAVSLTDPDRWGPQDGWAWDLKRFAIDGLVAGGGTPAQNEGSQAAPVANTTIVAINAPALTPGTYIVHWKVDYDGTPSATDVNNFRLKFNSATIAQGIANGAVGEYPQDDVELTVPAGFTAGLLIQSGPSAATAGSVYSGQLSIVPVPDDQVTLYRGAAIPPNRIHTFTPPGTSPGPDVFFPSKSVLLQAQDTLTLAGSGLAGAQIVAWGAGVEVEINALPGYLA